jgi:histidine kinase
MLRFLRTHLAWKVFLSYVLVVLVGALVLIAAANLSAPAAFQRHLAGMSTMMSAGNRMGNASSMAQDLFAGYRAAVADALSLAALAALVAAVLASLFISHRVVSPVQRMTKLSRRIAEGEYEERLAIPGDVRSDQLDELARLALSFNQMADKLERTEALRRQLIGDVTHELRTPLAAIKGYMEGLMDGVLPAQTETYQQVHAEVDRLQRLVDDLQELSRVESGAYKLKLGPVSVPEVIETVMGNLGRSFADKGILLEVAIEPGLPPVTADRDRILQVLTNLAGNALQYTPSGGSVTIRATREPSEVVVSVADTGTGIAAEHLPHIFDRFYRTDRSRARASGGSGIGLTIAQALVKAHGGRIWAESAGVDQGSTFHFTLPLPGDARL